MKLTKLTLCLATLALGVASAASSFTITLPSAITAGDKQLKPGEYKVAVEGNQAIFKQGKTTTAIPVSTEKSTTKFKYTSLETESSKLQAIDLGGTTTKLVVSPAGATGNEKVGE